MRIKRGIIITILLFIITIAGGAAIYSYFEGWNLFDSFYFVIITITTIGYGDLAPTTVYGKSFTMFLAFFGVALALYVLSQIKSNMHYKDISKDVKEIKKDVKEIEEEKQKKKK